MRLVYTADREAAVSTLVHSAASFLVLVVEGAAVLIDHDAILVQRFKAAAVKLFCEKPGRVA